MCPGDFTKSVRQLLWILSYEYIHQGTNAQLQLEIFSDNIGRNRKN